MNSKWYLNHINLSELDDQTPKFIAVPFPSGRNCKAPREAKAKAMAPKRRATDEDTEGPPAKRRKKKRAGASSAPSAPHPTSKAKKAKKSKKWINCHDRHGHNLVRHWAFELGEPKS